MKDSRAVVKNDTNIEASRSELEELPLSALYVERSKASARVAEIDAAIAVKHSRAAVVSGSVPVFTSLDVAPEIRHLKNARRVHAETCRCIATATKDGHVWTVPQADWYAARRGPGRPPRSTSIANTNLDSEIEAIDRAIGAAGFRATRRSA